MFIGYLMGVITGAGVVLIGIFLGYRTAQQHNLQADDADE